MIDSKELLFVVSENNRPLKPRPRDEAHAQKLFHRTSGVWIYNSKGQVLCQKRSVRKDVNPNLWEAFFGGHLAPKEDYLQNAAKETSEELGLPLDPGALERYKVFKSDKQHHKEFQQVAFLHLDAATEDLNPEREEIDRLEWLPISKLEKILLIDKSNKWVHKPWEHEVLGVLQNRVASC